MRYQPIDPYLFKKNRKKVLDALQTRSIAIVHAHDEMPRNGDQYYSYRQNSDLFYLTGIEQEKTILILNTDHPSPKMRELLFIIKPDEKSETWFGHKLRPKEAADISGITNVQFLENFEAVLDEMTVYADHIYFNANEYAKFIPEVESRDSRKGRQIREKYPSHQFKRLAPVLTLRRLQKEKEEIMLMKKACEITGRAFERVLKFTRPGVKEYEVEAEIQHEFLINGAMGSAYAPIIASGENALTLHYIENSHTCRDGDLLLMDFGAEYANYAADCSRTIPVNGKFTKRQKEYYNAVLRVQKEIKKHYVVGNTIDGIGREVIKLMEKELLELGLITKKQIQEEGSSKSLVLKYLVHGIAHFIGLDVHDVGNRFEKFRAGMILTCEPGLYIKEENTGIRIENNILITEEGPVDLMEDIPVEAEEIENLMRRS